jgi:hypothetical protein
VAHSDAHPVEVPGCFGCKVSRVGIDRKHLTRTTRDELGHDTTEHRDGRQDVTIRAPRIRIGTQEVAHADS